MEKARKSALPFKPKPAPRAALQRKCACGGTPGPTGQCEECRQTREAGMLQRQAVQPATFNPERSDVPPIVREVLRSPAQPLDPAARAFFEPRFGHDFSQVRVHTGEKAEESVRAVGAFAYTVGQDLVFGARQYAP